MRCKGPDGNIHDTTWLWINGAWLPAISVCIQGLFAYETTPTEGGDAMTLKIVDVPIVEGIDSGTISVTPNAGRTVCRFNESFSGDYDLDADLSNCVIGDELILIFNITDSFTINMSTDKFIFNNDDDGEGHTSITRSVNGNVDRWALAFTFDGEKFVSTYEHC